MNPLSRNPDRLTHESFDLLIVGGGITGATLAWEAVHRGLRVALVERGDFASATTSATSKLIHGGLRYLKNGELGLVRESLRERSILQTIAPHLVRPLPFVIPTYRTGNKHWMIKAGMVLYDMLSYDRKALSDPERRIPPHHMLSVAELLQKEPDVAQQGLTGGAVYYDCRCEPERLCLEFILGAADRGACVLNYTELVKLECREGRVRSIAVRDRLTGTVYELSAPMVANVAGPWADHIDWMCGVGDPAMLKRSKGIHLVTRSLSQDLAMVLRTRSGQHFFIIPWRGHSLIGTTDTEYQGDLDQLQVTEEDVKSFIAEINQVYPAAALTPADVTYRYVGVRPLVEQDTQVYQASRKYDIIDHHRRGMTGIISAIGGKYTTSRSLAKKMVDRILAALNRPLTPSPTSKTLLPGGVSGSFSQYERESIAAASDLLPEEVLRYLIGEYGARHAEVLELVRKDSTLGEQVVADRPEILAQVVHAVKHEMASTFCDILIRRTGIGTLGGLSPSTLDQLLALAAKLLEWDEPRRQKERQAYLNKTLGLPEHSTWQ